jgi:pimeloyl-ACP methyl ester carboxylesterase
MQGGGMGREQWACACMAAVALLAGCAWTPEPKSARTEVGRYSYIEAGKGEPAIVFEAGPGNGKAVWEPVFADLSKTTRVFAYDRAGIGTSVARSNDRSGKQVVQELRALLDAAGVNPPYVLVGHSSGGIYMDLFARTYPGDTVGLVHIDGLHAESAIGCFPGKAGTSLCSAPSVMLDVYARSADAMEKEKQGWAATIAQLREAGPFPPIPLVLISGTRNQKSDERDANWLAARAQYAKISPQGREIICADCSWTVQHDDPKLVVNAIRDLVSQARAGAK